MIVDYRVYVTAFVLGYILLFVAIILTGSAKWWGRVMAVSICLMGTAGFFGFLDWLWS